MYQLNFPNGNVQTYNSYGDLDRAARALGGKAKLISGRTYAFVPNKYLHNYFDFLFSFYDRNLFRQLTDEIDKLNDYLEQKSQSKISQIAKFRFLRDNVKTA